MRSEPLIASKRPWKAAWSSTARHNERLALELVPHDFEQFSAVMATSSNYGTETSLPTRNLSIVMYFDPDTIAILRTTKGFSGNKAGSL
jgi:hypothetical protein